MINNKYISNLGNFFQYLGATLFVAILQVTINPLLAQNLSPTDYAIIGYYSSFTILLTPFITFFITNFFIKKYFQVDEKEREIIKSTCMKSLIYFSLFLSIISLIALYVYHQWFNSRSGIAFLPYALLTIFAIPITGIYNLKLSEYRLQRKASKFAILTIAVGLITVLSVLGLVVFVKGGATGRLWATFLSNCLAFLYVFYAERRIIFHGTFDKDVAKELIRFYWPLTLAGMLGFFSNGYDKVFLERLGNIEELGYYSVGVQIAAYLGIFSNAVNSTFQPDIYECYSKRNFKRLFTFVSIIVGSISCAVIVYLILSPYIIDILTAGRYLDSVRYSQIFAFSFVTASIYYSSSQISIAMGYSKMLLTVKILGGIVSILLFKVLIGEYGFVGAAYGSVFTYVVFFILNTVFLFSFKHKELMK